MVIGTRMLSFNVIASGIMVLVTIDNNPKMASWSLTNGGRIRFGYSKGPLGLEAESNNYRMATDWLSYLRAIKSQKP